MNEFDLVVQNGTVVTAADTIKCDIGIKDGKIRALAECLADGKEIVDAGGMYVLPGGIDAHVHLDEPPFYGVLLNDSFETGTRAAACGGTTTIISFAQQQKGRPLRSSINDYHAKASGNAVIDYGFHVILTDPSEEVANKEIPALIEDGYTSYKCFMTYDGYLDDGQILKTMEVAKRERAMVMIHAENEHCIRHMAKKFDDEGHTSLASFPKMAPMCVEREGTHRAISMSELVNVPILLVHVSGREAMDQIRWGPGPRVEDLWRDLSTVSVSDRRGLQEGRLGSRQISLCTAAQGRGKSRCVVARDRYRYIFRWSHRITTHSSSTAHRERRPAARSLISAKSHRAFPVSRRDSPLVFSEGVSRGRIDINTFVATTATNPARIYGLYPRKGTIAVGADADIAIWDPEMKQTISRISCTKRLTTLPTKG